MKKIYAFLLTFGLALAMLVPFISPLPAYAKNDYPNRHIFDVYLKLPFEQDENLEKKAQALFGQVPMYVVIVEGGDNPDYMERFGLTRDDDFVLLMVHTNGYGWYYDMHIYGKYVNRISEAEMNDVLDHPDVYDNIKNGYLYSGISAWLTETAKVAGVNVWRRLGISAAIGAGVALLVSVGIVIRYAMKQKSTQYPLNRFAKMQQGPASDRFITKTVTSRTVSNGNSGGKSGGGGGGGRHGGR